MSPRGDRATQIRDRVLERMKGASRIEEISGVRCQVWREGVWMAALNTPFNPFGHIAPEQMPGYDHVLAYQRAATPLPYELSLWRDLKKVLSVEWANDGSARVISFKRGPWEDELLS